MSNTTQPTYYGPVETGGSSSTAIDTQTQGSLAVLVQQPTDNSPQNSSNGALYVEEWKGPYSIIKELPFGQAGGIAQCQLGQSHSSIVSGSKWVSRFTCPGSASDWYLEEVQVRQIEAGDHGILRLTWRRKSDASGDPEEPVGSETWNIKWQPYSVSPYAFCANNDPGNAKYAGSGGSGSDDTTSTAYAQHIKDCIEQPADSGQQLKQFYDYMNATTAGKIYTLNAMERAIMDKVEDDKSPTYHFPILTKSTVTVFESQLSSVPTYPKTIGGSVDVKSSSVPTGCPYTFDSTQWKEWLKTGDDMNLTR